MKNGTLIREHWLDLAKGVAIIAVILQHSLQRTTYFFYGMAEDNVLSFTSIASWFISSVNMQWFFVISGYIYFAKQERYLSSPISFIKTRFVDLMIPYLLLGPLVWLGKYLLSAYVKNQVSFDDLLNMFIVPIAFMWFIYVLFYIEVIILLFDKLVRINYKYKLIILFVVYLVLALTTKYHKDVFWRVCFFSFWYYLGGAFYRYKAKIPQKTTFLSLLGGAIWLLSFGMSMICARTIFSIIWTFGSVLFIMMFFQNRQEIKGGNIALNFWGNKTMILYILNPIVLNGLKQVLLKLDLYNISICFFCFFVGTVLITSFIAYVVPKIPPVEFIFSPRKYIIKS